MLSGNSRQWLEVCRVFHETSLSMYVQETMGIGLGNIAFPYLPRIWKLVASFLPFSLSLSFCCILRDQMCASVSKFVGARTAKCCPPAVRCVQFRVLQESSLNKLVAEEDKKTS